VKCLWFACPVLKRGKEGSNMIPTRKNIELPLLRIIHDSGGELRPQAAYYYNEGSFLHLDKYKVPSWPGWIYLEISGQSWVSGRIFPAGKNETKILGQGVEIDGLQWKDWPFGFCLTAFLPTALSKSDQRPVGGFV